MGGRARRVQGRRARPTLTPGVAPWRGALLAGTSVLVLDQVTKWWVVENLGSGRTIDLFWTLRLRTVFNTGAAFSQGQGLGPIFAVLILVVVALLVRLGAEAESLRGRGRKHDAERPPARRAGAADVRTPSAVSAS